jgi:hypothetical protein
MKKYTYFDLEDAIQRAWQTSDDIELFFKYHGDAEQPMTEDEVANTLLGMKSLHDMRCWQLMDTLARVFELNQYCTDPEKLAARNALFGHVDDIMNETKPKKKGSKK